jgi:hypothetical protein
MNRDVGKTVAGKEKAEARWTRDEERLQGVWEVKDRGWQENNTTLSDMAGEVVKAASTRVPRWYFPHGQIVIEVGLER